MSKRFEVLMLLHFAGHMKKPYIKILEVSKMNGINSRRQFTREFKLETVEFLLHGDKTVVEVARDLGIRVDTLYRWKKEYLNDKNHSFSRSRSFAEPRGGTDTYTGTGVTINN